MTYSIDRRSPVGPHQIGTSKSMSDDRAKWHNLGMHPPKILLKTLFLLTHESRNRTSGQFTYRLEKIDVEYIVSDMFGSLMWSEPDD